MITRRSKQGLIIGFSFLMTLFKISIIPAQQTPVTDSIAVGMNQEHKRDTTLDRRAIRESVETGYGTRMKRDLTTSVTGIKSDEFNKGNIENPLQLIQGKVAGLFISKPGGDPNGVYQVRIRGLNTIYGIGEPLIVIDGIIDGSLDNTDPNDIESISVLKDGSSAAIYGTRGSNGVILVTTMRGKKGTAAIDYNVYTTLEMVARNNPAMNAKEWRALSSEVGFGTDYGASTYWFREIEQNGLSQVHNLSMSGGTDKTNYRASVNYRSGNGILKNTRYDQINGRLNISQKALNDKLTLDLNLAATQRESQFGFADAFRYASIFNPTSPVKSSDPAYAQYDGYFQQNVFDYYNPASIVELDKNEGTNRILNLSLKGSYELIKGVHLDAFYSIQTIGALGGQYYDKNDFWGGYYRNGLASRQEDNSSNRLFETIARFNSDLTPDLNLKILGGYSYQDFTNEGFSAQGGDFTTDAFSFNNLSAALNFKNGYGTITSYKNSNRLVAFFGRVNLNIKSLWFFSASVRYEGSSRFGSANKWDLFPSLGAGIDFARLLSISSADYLKLRFGYGVTGNQPAESYISLEQLDHNYAFNYYNYPYNGKFIPVYTVSNNPFPGLKGETKTEFDAGFDFSFHNSKLSGSIDLYSSSATNLLFQNYVQSPPNLYYYAWMNLGKIRNSGLELSLNYNVVKKSDLSFTIFFASSFFLNNRIVSLSGKYNGIDLKYGTQDLGYLEHGDLPLIKVAEGKPVGQIEAWVFKEIGPDGQLILTDLDNNGYVNYADIKVVGNGLPKILIGFSNVITFKNWDLNIFLRGVLGHNLINSYRAEYEAPHLVYYYNVPETTADMRNPSTHTLMSTSSGVYSSKDVEDASFVSLDNICLGYNFLLPEKSSFRKIRLYLAGNNLFYITWYKGSDPNPRYSDTENYGGTYNNPLIPGVDRMDTWPRTRSVTFGANVVF
jgi:iron complex outermembrane receptor protein